MAVRGIPLPGRLRGRRARTAFSPRDWRQVGGMFAVVAGLHLVGFLVLLTAVVPQHYHLGKGGLFGLGVGITAYTLGLRHAFDADHVAAIDNATRKLMHEGQRPLSMGFFFSLGHSTVVFALAALFAAGIKGLAVSVSGGGSALHSTLALVGPLISGSVLIVIGILNLMILLSILRIFRRTREGDLDEAALNQQLSRRGFMNRLYSRATGAVRKPSHMYLLGLLFGLGFDTASEVVLLAAAGTAAAGGLPWYAILCLPVLFAAGMSLLDTIDGVFMNFAYGWAFSRPLRKLFYNVTVTGLSVAVALLIGSIELLSVLADRLNLTGGVWRLVAGLDINLAGYVIVGLFIATWAIALAAWRLGRIEQRWSLSVGES